MHSSYVVEQILQHDWTDKVGSPYLISAHTRRLILHMAEPLNFQGEVEGLRRTRGSDMGAGRQFVSDDRYIEALTLQTLIPPDRSGAMELLEEYFQSHGGRPQPPPKQAPRKRKATGEKPTPAKAQATKGVKRQKKSRCLTDDADEEDKPELALADEDEENWMPKKENWENEVVKVDTIGRDAEGGDGLYAYLHWKNGKRSKVSMELCYKKCPIKVSYVSRCLAYGSRLMMG